MRRHRTQCRTSVKIINQRRVPEIYGFFFSSRRLHTKSVSAFLLNRSSDLTQSTFSVKVLNLFSRSRRKTNKRKSKHSAMLRNKETRHRMFIGLLNTTRKLA